MDSKEVYLKKLKLIQENIEISKRLIKLKKDNKKIMEECPHDIILKFDDQALHKVSKIYYYFCPACGKKIDEYGSHTIDKTIFKNSKIINLTEYPMSDLIKYYDNIINYIFNNYDYFYNSDISTNDLKENILDNVKVKIRKK